MTKKTWIIFVVMCLALVGGMVYLSRNNKLDVSNVDVSKIQEASADNGNIGDRVYGKADSKVVLIEYADYQCPGCASAHPAVKKVVEKYKDKIAFVFRNFPMSYHANARAAAAVAESAGLQGKFWEMNHLLYDRKSDWTELGGSERTDYFAKLAEELNLDVEKFRSDLTSPEVLKKIAYDEALARKAEITGTPGFRLNGKNVGDLKALDGKLASGNDENATYVWANAENFEKLVIQPALKEAGIEF